MKMGAETGAMPIPPQEDERLCNITGEARAILTLVAKQEFGPAQAGKSMEPCAIVPLVEKRTSWNVRWHQSRMWHATRQHRESKGSIRGPPHLDVQRRAHRDGQAQGGGRCFHCGGAPRRPGGEATMVAEKCKLVRLCRFFPGCATKFKRDITLYFARVPEAVEVRRNVCKAMEKVTWDRKYGKARPTFIEHALRE